MSNLLRGQVIGVNNDNSLVYVEVKDNNGVLDLTTYTCNPFEFHVDNNLIYSEYLSKRIAPFFHLHESEGESSIWGFTLCESELHNEILDMKYTFHKDALYDLYNTYYLELGSNLVESYQIGSLDYYFPDIPKSVYLDFMLDAYISTYPNGLKDFDKLYTSGRGAEELKQNDINHILGKDNGYSI